MKPDKVLSLLGIAAKAGNVASGEFSTEKAVKEGKAHLVIVAADASDNTKKRFSDMCTYYNCRYFEYSDKEMLGHCIGKEFRASAAIKNEGLANEIIRHLDKTTTE